MSKKKVNRVERGWAAHYICADKCRFRRNTLLTFKNVKIVVSTVGNMITDGDIEQIGYNRYYKTKAFHAKKKDTRYFNGDVNKEIRFNSNSCGSISEPDVDDKANNMHEAVVEEITMKLIREEI